MAEKMLGNYKIFEREGLVGLSSTLLSRFPELFHVFSTRMVNSPELRVQIGELNLSLNCPEFQSHFEIFAKAFGFNPNQCVFSHQAHGKNVAVVTSKDIGTPYWERKLREVDGLITNEKGLLLVTTYADCMPIVAYDPVKNVVGVAHSGWRGTLLEIAKELVLKMNEEFGSSPMDLFVTIGPSIGPESFEVGPEVAEEFFLRFGRGVLREVEGRIHVDLWKAAEISLQSVGVTRVEISGIDTFKHTELLYSYRKEGTKKRFACVVGIVG